MTIGKLGVSLCMKRQKLTDASIAGVHASEQVDAQRGVFVVSSELLLDFPGVACVSTRAIVGESLGASELVVGAGSGDDVAVGGDLAGKTLHRAGHWMLSVRVTRRKVWLLVTIRNSRGCSWICDYYTHPGRSR